MTVNSWNYEIEKRLKELIIIHDRWADITNIINSEFDLSLSISAVKSYAYRRNLVIQRSQQEPLTEYEEIKKKFRYIESDDIPVYEISTKKKWIPIWSPSDLHIGSVKFDEDTFDADRDWVIKNIDPYLIGIGDWLECSTPGSMPKSMFSQNMTPKEQKNFALKKFLAFKNKTITIIDGNHEKRIYQGTSFTPLEDIASELGGINMPYGGVINVVVNNIEYKILLKHGASFSVSNAEVAKWGNIYRNVDVVMLGHTHICESFLMNEGFEIVNNKRIQTNQIGVRCGHYLGYGGYVEERPLKPLKSDSVILWLNSQTKDIIITKVSDRIKLN